MKYIATIVMGIGSLCMAVRSQGQTTDSISNRTVIVENQYNPEVMDAFKVNMLPKVEEPAASKEDIEYAIVPHFFNAWQFTPMQPMAVSEKEKETARGFFRAAYGNRNNADAMLSYLWDISQQNRLQVSGAFYGLLGDIPSWNSDMDKWKSRFYSTNVSVDYRHSFHKVSLSVGGSFVSQVFNYMPTETEEGAYVSTSGHQRFTTGEGYVGITSVKDAFPVEFTFRTGLRNFGIKHDVPGLGNGSENVIHTQGGISGTISEGQQVGIGIGLDNVIYDAILQDYTLMKLNPYYLLMNGCVQLRIGVNADWQFSNGGGGKISPDVKFDCLWGDAFRFYIHVTGGTMLNDWYHLNDVSPYWIQVDQINVSYIPLDAKAGLKWSLLAGLGFQLSGGYRITENDLFLIPNSKEEGFPYGYSLLSQEKSKVGYGGFRMDYSYKDYFDVSVDAAYSHWNVANNVGYLLSLKPEFALNASVRARVYAGLWAGATYGYENRMSVDGVEQMDAVNNLSLVADYTFFDRIDVSLHVRNVLNKYYIAPNGYPVQGFYAMGGVGIRF